MTLRINALSLLALKVAPRVFDLSSDQHHVSIRDQIVRAQQLIQDLCMGDPAAKSILIVGAGVAGVAAAMSACEAGFRHVHLLDVKSAPFSLFSGVTSRYVGPFMYEWPSTFCDNQSFASHDATIWSAYSRSCIEWEAKDPVSANELATILEKKFLEWFANRIAAALPVPELRVDVSHAFSADLVLKFAANSEKSATLPDNMPSVPIGYELANGYLWPKTALADSKYAVPDYLILAMGMGKENAPIPGVNFSSLRSFWANDSLKSPKMKNRNVVVLGGGDGALQDTLRALTTFHHPLDFVRHLEEVDEVRQAISVETARLLDADRQQRQHMSWDRNSMAFSLVDDACRAAAERLAKLDAVRSRVLNTLNRGTGQVSLFVRGIHFDKAYLLNRFAIYLLWACCLQRKGYQHRNRVQFELAFERQVTRVHKFKPQWMLNIRSARTRKRSVTYVDHLVLRFGIKKKSVPAGQMLQLSAQDSQQRINLRTVELPFVNLRKPSRRH